MGVKRTLFTGWILLLGTIGPSVSIGATPDHSDSKMECKSRSNRHRSKIRLQIERKSQPGSQNKYQIAVRLYADVRVGKSREKILGKAELKGQTAFTENLVEAGGPSFAVSSPDRETTAKIFELDYASLIEADYPVYGTKHPVEGGLPGYLLALRMGTSSSDYPFISFKGILGDLNRLKTSVAAPQLIGRIHVQRENGSLVSIPTTEFKCIYRIQ